MSFVSKSSKAKKKAWNWEPDVLRCDNCKHFRNKHFFLLDSMPRVVDASCVAGGFRTNPNAACDVWEEKRKNVSKGKS